MTLPATEKLAKHIMRLLKVQSVQFPVCRTSKGNLTVEFNESISDYRLFLDSVPLPTRSILEDENNIYLKNIVDTVFFDSAEPRAVIAEAPKASIPPAIAPKKRGRPKKK